MRRIADKNVLQERDALSSGILADVEKSMEEYKTDGVPEAANQENKLFGTDRMLASLNQNAGSSLTDILHRLQNDIDVFAEGAMQFDDITMLGFDYLGERGEQGS